MLHRLAAIGLLLSLTAAPVLGQGLLPTQEAPATASPYAQAPKPLQILGLSVQGVEDESMRTFVLQSSGLTIGEQVTLPGDQALADAIRSIYETRLFSDVAIVEERRAGDGVFLAIRVKEEPRLKSYSFENVKRRHRDELKKKVPLLSGTRVRPADLERSKQVIREFYEEKGYLLAEVEANRTVTEDNALEIEFSVDRGAKVEVEDIIVRGNQEVSDRKIRRKMKETDVDRWWRFWSGATFDRDKYEEDLDKVVAFYNEQGYYDARIVRDTVYLQRESDDPGVVVELEVHEGDRYYIRDIAWDGNTVYRDEALTQALGLEKGDAYNSTALEENLYGNRRSSDVASLYMNQGYMRFNVEPTIEVVEGDSLDITFDVFEGEVYQFGEITIAGNTKTKEHVIRRELYTIPGQTFSRDAIQETVRRLSQLKYFEQSSLSQGPSISIDEQAKAVDLSYQLEEVGSDQLELSGTYGRFGVVLQLRFNFNNFSMQDALDPGAWRPLPAGDGQKLSLSVQTNGTSYQSYSLGFTEPWFRGRPQPVGFNVGHTRFNTNPFNEDDEGDRFVRTSADVFYRRRLQWPDDKFSASVGLGYQFFNNEGITSTLPNGISQEVTLRQSLSRNSVDNPMFPTRGSEASLSLDLAMPFPGAIQYHKWRFNSTWNVPLANKLTLSFGADYGYIGTLTGDDVQFERFVVGGSPFDSQGFNNFFGKDIVYMRGYPARALGPRLNDEPVGGRILNKYTSELRWLAVQSPQLQAAPYLFLDAANTWDGFDTYSPSQLFRSGGMGVRLFLPILGVLELAYGYNFDTFEPVRRGNHDGSRRWLFQFSLGQGF
ncbi:MAG: outer membrane protein assembly factor BamA [Bacteroidetes bacterium]|jgi:outer membrane protein insertion porin family|nr:outer membrane protein assembly factor BamA [Bacteroidota bacterium]